MEIKINLLEVAAELAELEVLRVYNGDRTKVYEVNEESGDTQYTDEAQEEFNEFYDFYFDFILERDLAKP